MIDGIQILFKTENPWGVNDLSWGGKLGGFGGPPRYGGILGVMGPLNGGILGTMYPSEQKARAAVLTYLSRQQGRSRWRHSDTAYKKQYCLY